MYEELIKRLRNCAEGFKCRQCEYELVNGCRTKLNNEAADAIEELIAALTASNEVIAKSKPRWIPVSERLPDFEGAVLCMRKSYIHREMRHQEIMYVDEKGFCNVDDVYAEPGNITHWMPLPEPPDHIGDANEMVEQ